MKNVLVLFFLFINISLLAQAQKGTNSKKVTLGFGMSLGLENIDEVIAEDIGISSYGSTLLDFRGRINLFKYVNLDAGLTISQFKDKLPYTEALVYTSGQLSGLPTSGKSEIISGGHYYSLGGRIPLTSQFNINAAIGKRRFSASRDITNCTNCKKTDIEIDAGNYVRTGLSWLSFGDDENAQGEVDLLYTHYFDKSFQYTITLGFLVYF